MKKTELTVRTAKLPGNYEAAKVAISECSRIDECKEWADKAAALASYARQSNDETLLRQAVRIRDRAVRRAGLLIEQIPAAKNQHDARARGPGSPSSRKQAIADAGLSTDQGKTAVRVARIPEKTFERLVESDVPPTSKLLSKFGTDKKPPAPRPEQLNPAFPKATKALGTVRRFAEFCEQNNAAELATAVMGHEVGPTRKRIGVIDGWLDVFATSIGSVIDV